MDRACCFGCQQSRCLCDRVAHVAVRLYPGECVLHLHKCIQPSSMVKVQKNPSESTTDARDELLTGGKRLSTTKEAAATLDTFFQDLQGRNAGALDLFHLGLS